MSVKLLVQTIIYGLITVLGFFVAVPIGVTSNKMSGFCIMSGSGEWKDRGFKQFFELNPTNKKTTCNFNIYFHVVSTILFAAVMTGIYIFLLVSAFRGHTRKVPYGVVIASLITNTIILLITFVSGCIISAGFNSFCGYIVAGPLSECSQAQTRVTWNNGMDGSSFHMNYLMAISCCWLVVLLWGVIVAMDAIPFIMMYRAHRRERTQRGRATTTTVSSISDTERI